MKFIPVCEPYLNGREMRYIRDVVKTGWISSSGKYLKLFEERFAEYCGVKYASTTSNGTTALHLALTAIGVSRGDEVIIPNFTMASCAFAVCYLGATPVFVEPDPLTWNIDPDKIERKITKKTKAIMAVHIFGHPCDMGKISITAKKHGLKVVEDGAEAIGSEYCGKKVGALADIAAFSFFANKNITTGEGGMTTTDDGELDEKVRYYKNVCFSVRGERNYRHDDIGFNYRMTNMQAAVGLAQTEKAGKYVRMRIRNAQRYREGLGDVQGVALQQTHGDVVHATWMNAVLIDPDIYGRSKEELINHLSDRGIETRRLFVGMHQQPFLKKHGCDCSGDYHITENLTGNGLYLPSGSNLSGRQIAYICDVIKEFAKQRAA